MLVDAAVQLCIERGYNNTTVEQIAAAAEVSPRTFSRYFPTKDAVIMTMLDDLVDAAVSELAQVGDQIPPLTALTHAHARALRGVQAGDVASLSNHRLVLVVNVISSSNTLRRAATVMPIKPLVVAMAARMGVDPEDQRVALVVSVWSAITAAAWGHLVIRSDDYGNCAGIMADRLRLAFTEFADIATLEVGSALPSSV